MSGTELAQGPYAGRTRASPALAAYLGAFVLAPVTSLLFAVAVAYARSPGMRGTRAHLLDDAQAFVVSPAGIMAGALVNSVVLAAVTLVAVRLQGRPFAARLRVGPSRATWTGTVAATTGMLGLSCAGGSLSELLEVRGGGVLDTITQGLDALSPVRFALAILTVGVAPALAEETLFRGLIQTRLVASWGRWPAIATTAAAFGLLHLDPVQGTLALVAGLFLGWLAERFGGIRPTIAAHAVNNAAFVGLASLGAGAATSRTEGVAFAVAGTAVWVASVAVLRSRRAVVAIA